MSRSEKQRRLEKYQFQICANSAVKKNAAMLTNMTKLGEWV
ncbi:hypothetical protein [Bythopirellula polymerisocia]|nr:hypothetical protein [Bythopirellula polymerisocia]